MYNYLYEDGVLTEAVESTVTLNEFDFVTSKIVLNTIRYIYDNEGTLTKKRIFNSDGEQVITYKTAENEAQLVKTVIGENNFVSTSKTDSFGRKEFDELQLERSSLYRRFDYLAGEATDEHLDNKLHKSTPTTQLVSKITFQDGRTIDYEYDAEERITKVTDSVDGVTEYVYDVLGQLIYETKNDQLVTIMTYDDYGNIIHKNGINYSYDTVWKDKLIKVGDQTITYDAQGNPINYLGHILFWEKGRQLKSFDGIQYTYNANGIRTSKTVDNVRHDFYLDSGKILKEVWNGNVLEAVFDNEESVCGIVYNGEPFYFVKNLQGDIIAITDKDGEIVARYTYDAWGVCTVDTTSTNITIANLNPYRYRGYYYDSEIGMYYLQSRYYDPEVGRFVNGDEASYIYADGNNYVVNLFAYCENNPINMNDPNGTLALLTCVIIGAIVGAAIGAIASKMIYGKVNGWWVLGGAVVGGVLGYVGGAFFGASGIKAGTLAYKIKMTKVRWLGKIGEKMAKWSKNRKHIESLTKSAKYRVPDYLNKTERVIGEVKNVKKLKYTKQLQDFVKYARKNDYTFILKVRRTTKFDEGLMTLIELGEVVIMYLYQ